MVLIGYAIKCDGVWTPNICFARPGEDIMTFAEVRAMLLKSDMDEMYPGHRREVVPLFTNNQPEHEIW